MAAKLLWLHAEFLEAGGDADAADAMFAQSYAATGQVICIRGCMHELGCGMIEGVGSDGVLWTIRRVGGF